MKSFPAVLFGYAVLLNSISVNGNDFEIESVRDGFASILNRQHSGNRIGYRFFEHTPMTYGEVPASPEQAGVDPQRVAELESQCKQNSSAFVFAQQIANDEHWIRQDWTFYMSPVDDGIDLVLIVATHEEGLPEYYGVQQCFRLTGKTNGSAWRKSVALAPAFSEYDLWSAEGDSKTSLTYVVRAGRWESLPARKGAVGARTPTGVAIDLLRSHGQLGKRVGPYKAEMLAPIDVPLIARVDQSDQWICGIYWETASHVTNHHPADCLHPIINIGGIPPFSRRAFRGKIYWFQGNTHDLLSRYQSDN